MLKITMLQQYFLKNKRYFRNFLIKKKSKFPEISIINRERGGGEGERGGERERERESEFIRIIIRLS